MARENKPFTGLDRNAITKQVDVWEGGVVTKSVTCINARFLANRTAVLAAAKAVKHIVAMRESITSTEVGVKVSADDLHSAHKTTTDLITEIDRAATVCKLRNKPLVVPIRVSTRLWDMCTQDFEDNPWGRIPPQLLVRGNEANLLGADVESCYKKKGMSAYSTTFAPGLCFPLCTAQRRTSIYIFLVFALCAALAYT